MSIRNLTGDKASDELLAWLDGHSASVSLGLAVPLMYKKWVQANRDPEKLADSLQKLIETDWIEVTPDTEPAHLRFTCSGYAKLLEPVAQSIDTPPPAAQVAPMPTVAAPAVAPTRPPPVPAPRPVLMPTVAENTPVWLLPDAPPTEIGLRNQLLEVFRELGLRAGGLINATRLSRYWQEMGQRASNLRLGLDVLLRDRYLRPQRIGMDMIFELTKDGDGYLRAPLTPAALVRMAPPVSLIQPGVVSEKELSALTALASIMQKETGENVDYSILQFTWAATGLEDNDLIHGLDLLYKAGHVQFDMSPPGLFNLTSGGLRFARNAKSELRGDAAKRAAQLG